MRTNTPDSRTAVAHCDRMRMHSRLDLQESQDSSTCLEIMCTQQFPELQCVPVYLPVSYTAVPLLNLVRSRGVLITLSRRDFNQPYGVRMNVHGVQSMQAPSAVFRVLFPALPARMPWLLVSWKHGIPAKFSIAAVLPCRRRSRRSRRARE